MRPCFHRRRGTGAPGAVLAPVVALACLLGAARPAQAQLGPNETGPGLEGATPAAPAGATRPAPPRGRKVEWIALHAWLGGIQTIDAPSERAAVGGAELVLFTPTWRHVYWEILRIGGGWPFMGWLGTAVGLRVRLDRALRHELRIGVHVTFALFNLYLVPGPTESGLQVRYLWRRPSGVTLHVGLMQLSFPFIGAVLTLGIGL